MRKRLLSALVYYARLDRSIGFNVVKASIVAS